MFEILFNDAVEVDEEFKNRAMYGRKLADKTKYEQMSVKLQKNGEVNETHSTLQEHVKYKIISVH